MAGQIRCFLSEPTRRSSASKFDTHDRTYANHILWNPSPLFSRFRIVVVTVQPASRFGNVVLDFSTPAQPLMLPNLNMRASDQILLDRRLCIRSCRTQRLRCQHLPFLRWHIDRTSYPSPNTNLYRHEGWFTDFKASKQSWFDFSRFPVHHHAFEWFCCWRFWRSGRLPFPYHDGVAHITWFCFSQRGVRSCAVFGYGHIRPVGARYSLGMTVRCKYWERANLNSSI